MTPFGAKLRELRRVRGLTLQEMAKSLEISSAYLSALEHGKRGRPSPMLVRQICTFFTIIWEEAEELERLVRVSHPRVVVDSAGLSPRATELANLLAERIGDLSEDELRVFLEKLYSVSPKRPTRR